MVLCIPNALALPRQPPLARSCAACTLLGQDGPTELRQGEVLNITGCTPDGSLVYAALRDGQGGLREGWLPADHVLPLEPEDAAAVAAGVRLSTGELLERTALVQVLEDWLDLDNPATLGLRAGEVLQLSMVTESWAFGRPLESPSRDGWFPLSLVQRIEPSLGSLAKRGQQELSASASDALVRLLKANTPPPPAPRAWEGDLPPAVVESAQHEEREMREHCEYMEARQAAAEAEARAEAEDLAMGGHAGEHGADAAAELFDIENAPEDSFPLVVCTMKFAPPKADVLLQLKVGDLLRVVSPLEGDMYYGFFEKGNLSSGWFPSKHVDLLEDPLRPEADSPEPQPGAPPLPPVPPALLQRGRQRPP